MTRGKLVLVLTAQLLGLSIGCGKPTSPSGVESDSRTPAISPSQQSPVGGSSRRIDPAAQVIPQPAQKAEGVLPNPKQPPPSDWVVTEHLAIKADDVRRLVPQSFAITHDSLHWTCLLKSGDGTVRVVDGQVTPTKWVHRKLVTTDRFGKTYPAWNEQGPVFLREGYPPTEIEETKRFEGALLWDDEGHLLAHVSGGKSLDDKEMLKSAVVYRYSTEKKDFEGAAFTPYSDIRNVQVRAPGGRLIVAGTRRTKDFRGRIFFVNEQEYGTYEKIHSVQLSEDGKVAVCLAEQEKKVFTVTVAEGKSKEGKKFEITGERYYLRLHDGGRHVSFTSGHGYGEEIPKVVVDDKVQAVSFKCFPDGVTVGFRKDGTPVVGFYRAGPVVSPDGTRTAEWRGTEPAGNTLGDAIRASIGYFWVDGKRTNEGWDTGYQPLDLTFSPNSAQALTVVRGRLAGKENERSPVATYALLDGNRHGPYAAVRTGYFPSQSHPYFSPDSRSWAILVKKKDKDNDGWQLVVDGQEQQQEYDDVGPTDTHVGFTADNRFTFLAQRGGAWYFVEAKRK